MKAFLDTSVLVATFLGDHQHHERSARLFLAQKTTTGCTAAHCLAEFYSVLTGIPGRHRASPDEATLFIRDIQDRLALTALDESEYVRVLEAAVESGISGGGIHDAVIAHCALKAKAQTIYTWNTKHFARLGPKITARLSEP